MRSRSIPVVLLLGATLLVAATSAAQERRYIRPRSAGDENQPPFSGAVLVGETLYLSGTLGIDSSGQIPDDPAEEARIALDNIKRTLEAADMNMDDLVSVQVFCSDVSKFSAFNEVYRTYFSKEFPARAFVGSGPLLFDATFEIQGIAVKR